MNPFRLRELEMHELTRLTVVSGFTAMVMSVFFIFIPPASIYPTMLYYSFILFLLITCYRSNREMRRRIEELQRQIILAQAVQDIHEILQRAKKRYEEEKKKKEQEENERE